MSFEPNYDGLSKFYPAVLTEPEAAEFLRIGLTKLRELRYAELVPHLPKKPVRYLSASLLEWLGKQEVPAKKTDQETKSKRSASYKTNTDKAALRAGILG